MMNRHALRNASVRLICDQEKVTRAPPAMRILDLETVVE